MRHELAVAAAERNAERRRTRPARLAAMYAARRAARREARKAANRAKWAERSRARLMAFWREAARRRNENAAACRAARVAPQLPPEVRAVFWQASPELRALIVEQHRDARRGFVTRRPEFYAAPTGATA